MSKPAPKQRKEKGPSRIAQQTAARLAAVQALYQREVSGGSSTGLIDQFATHRFGAEIEGDTYVTPDPALFSAVVRGATERAEDIDTILENALVAGWPLARLQAVLRAILRAGVWELLANREVDGPIIVSDYVHMAEAFFDEKEPGMANAVLDRVRREVRPDEAGGAP